MFRLNSDSRACEMYPKDLSNLCVAGGPDDRVGHCQVAWWLHASDAALEISKLEHVLPQALNHIRDATFMRRIEHADSSQLPAQRLLPGH